MTDTINNTRFKFFIGVLTALLIGLAVYTFTLFKDRKDSISTLERDKDEVQDELEGLIENYNEIIRENESKDTELLSARERIVMLLDSVKDSKANVTLITRFRREIDNLKFERVVLFRRVDSLKMANQRLSIERDSTTIVLNETIKVVGSVNYSNQQLSNTLEKAALIGITNLKSDAVIVRSSGKIVDTRRSSRADKIRACYTLAPNAIIEKGDRLLYVQVINPENNVIGSKGTIAFAKGNLTYSATTNVFYENEALDVCTLVSGTEDDLIEGLYVITVFDQGRSLGSTTLELK